MRNASRRSINKAQRRDSHDDASGVGEFRAVADRIMETGARYLERGREFLNTRSNDMRRDHEWEQDNARRAYRASRMSREQADPGGFGAAPWDRSGPREASHTRDHDLSDPYAPDEYAFSETGGRYGRGGNDYDDHRARAFDARAEALQEQRRHAGRYGHARHHDDGRGGRDEDFLPGSYGYGGEYRRDLAGMPGNFAYRQGGASEGSGFEDAALRRARRHSGTGGRGWPEHGRHAGDHRGRGPRGYTRSDQRILEDVSERLSDDPDVDASNIDVRCEQGRIVLEGDVQDRWMKHRAEDIADSVSGVNDVENRIRVAGRGASFDASEAQGTERRPRGEGDSASARGNKAGSGEANKAVSTASNPQPQQPH